MSKRIDMMTIEELEEKINKYNNLTFIVKADDKELLEEYKILKEKLKDKNNEIEYLNEVIDGLEEEKEELEDECYELEEENSELKEEIKEVKRENKKLKIEMIAREMKNCIDPKIIKASQISMKNCLDAIELMSKIEKR